MTENVLDDPQQFSAALYEIMQAIDPAVCGLELYEFRYCLDNVTPAAGWGTIRRSPLALIEARLDDSAFYRWVQLKPTRDGRPVLDDTVLALMQMLFVGLVTGDYPAEWVRARFYFDVRGFCFCPRTRYFTPAAIAHLGGSPYRQFEPAQRRFDAQQSLGYPEFKAANAEVDRCFMDIIARLAQRKGAPLIIAIAGQTAAGKTEIVARLHDAFHLCGKSTTTIELDNFFTDRDAREARGVDSLGKEAMHYELLQQCLADICAGKRIVTPRYDFISATSSHSEQGVLRAGRAPVMVEPADIIFMEGNFPFLLPEIAPLIGIKAMYLTDDAVRMKRKWRRDMDYRKKYDLYYFINRYFREQFLMAQAAYKPQMALCDLLVDTTGAAVWVTPEIQALLAPVGER